MAAGDIYAAVPVETKVADKPGQVVAQPKPPVNVQPKPPAGG